MKTEQGPYHCFLVLRMDGGSHQSLKMLGIHGPLRRACWAVGDFLSVSKPTEVPWTGKDLCVFLWLSVLLCASPSSLPSSQMEYFTKVSAGLLFLQLEMSWGRLGAGQVY